MSSRYPARLSRQTSFCFRLSQFVFHLSPYLYVYLFISALLSGSSSISSLTPSFSRPLGSRPLLQVLKQLAHHAKMQADHRLDWIELERVRALWKEYIILRFSSSVSDGEAGLAGRFRAVFHYTKCIPCIFCQNMQNMQKYAEVITMITSITK